MCVRERQKRENDPVCRWYSSAPVSCFTSKPVDVVVVMCMERTRQICFCPLSRSNVVQQKRIPSQHHSYHRWLPALDSATIGEQTTYFSELHRSNYCFRMLLRVCFRKKGDQLNFNAIVCFRKTSVLQTKQSQRLLVERLEGIRNELMFRHSHDFFNFSMHC